MKRIVVSALVLGAVVASACSDNTNAPASQLAITMASAYSAAPAGYSSLSSSYVGDQGMAFAPDFGRDNDDHGGRRGPFQFGGRGDGPGFGLGGGFMGGGLFGGFFGAGLARELFDFDGSCTYASGTGLVTCGPSTHNGLTSTRILQFQDAANVSQPKFDMGTTNSVTTKVTVAGTTTRHDSSTSTVSLSSNQSVTGLAAGSTKRTVNSASAGTESSTGTSKQGAFTAQRATGDTVTGVVIPASSTTSVFPYPTAGTIIRSMSATVTISGQSPTSSSRREVITYDGSATAKVVITLDGTTQNCTLPLPFGRMTCS